MIKTSEIKNDILLSNVCLFVSMNYRTDKSLIIPYIVAFFIPKHVHNYENVLETSSAVIQFDVICFLYINTDKRRTA